MILIGLSGRAGCGKDTVAQRLCQAHGFVQIALADPLRDGLAAMFRLADEQLNDRQAKETPVDWVGRSPRELLQTLGTEWGREHVAPDIWLRVAARRIEQINAVPLRAKGFNGVVVSDIRFENEAEWLRAQGGKVWHIRRHPTDCLIGRTATHQSEQHIPAVAGEPRVNNFGTIAQLHEEIDEIASALLERAAASANAEVRGVSRPAGEASSAEGATSTVVLEGKEE